jgi:hypothetical protein
MKKVLYGAVLFSSFYFSSCRLDTCNPREQDEEKDKTARIDTLVLGDRTGDIKGIYLSSLPFRGTLDTYK